MVVISIKHLERWLYLSEKEDKNNNNFLEKRRYTWRPKLFDAKVFESQDEAKIFYKVSKDRDLIEKLNGSEIAVRKILFKKELDLDLA